MGLFIKIVIDEGRLTGATERRNCARVCPVDALRSSEDCLEVVPENEDECILCYRCVEQAPPGAIQVIRTYEQWLLPA